jgi:ectoine hydroxylase-related dioxygenase (phytanoyl-CoA dioxygenase family)
LLRKETAMSLTKTELDRLPTQEDVSFYEEHGWWISPPILAEEEIEEARFGVERYYSGERDSVLLLEAGTDWTEARGNVLRQNDYVSLQIEEFRRLVHHPLIAAAAGKLARTSEIRLFHDQLLYKPPQARPSDTVVGWHTDIAYWKTCSSRNLLTAWIPFQSLTEEMGPMMVLDGSHRWGDNDRLEFFHESDHEKIIARIERHGAEITPIPMILERGQMSFHHCRTIHGSRANGSNQPRIALAVHMQDRANRYVRNIDDKGRPVSHLNDFLCRKDASGNPDYRDEAICPVLWTQDEGRPA